MRLFFGKNDVPEICMTCNSPVKVFLRAAGAFSPGKQWLTNGFGYICDGRGIIEADPLKGLDSQMAPALAIANLWYNRLSPSKGGGQEHQAYLGEFFWEPYSDKENYK